MHKELRYICVSFYYYYCYFFFITYTQRFVVFSAVVFDLMLLDYSALCINFYIALLTSVLELNGNGKWMMELH